MHLADPKKAPVKGEGRRKSEVGRMLKRPAGQEDLGDNDDGGEEDAIDPVLRNILGIGAGKPGAGRASQDGNGAGGAFGGDEEDEDDEGGGGDDGYGDDDDDGDEPSYSEASSHHGGRRSRRDARRSGRRGARGSRRPTSAAMNMPPRGSAPLRSQALGYVSLLRRGKLADTGDEDSGSAATSSSSGSRRYGGGGGGGEHAASALRGRILQAARGMMGAEEVGRVGRGPAAVAFAEERRVEDMPFSSYAERRAVLREDRERKIQARMMEMVHKGQMPPELLLDEDLAQSSKLDADSYENDPDAYETEELLGSDVSSISSTDDDNDTPELAARRARRRDRRRRDKIRVLKRRRRKLWAKKRRDIEDAKSRYYDDMIDELVRGNPLLHPPAASADLETKRAFLDRATAENMTRAKIDQMARWIYVVSVVVENLGMISGFLMLEGLSQAVDAELRKPEMQPVIAQLARKYLRRGPSSPEWGLAIMFLGTAGTVHAMNVRQQEIAQAAAGQGSATGPGSSKFGRIISGAMKLYKALGMGGDSAAPPAGVQVPGGAEAAIAARYEPAPAGPAAGRGGTEPRISEGSSPGRGRGFPTESSEGASATRREAARPASFATATTARPVSDASVRLRRGRDDDEDSEDQGSRAPWE